MHEVPGGILIALHVLSHFLLKFFKLLKTTLLIFTHKCASPTAFSSSRNGYFILPLAQTKIFRVLLDSSLVPHIQSISKPWSILSSKYVHDQPRRNTSTTTTLIRATIISYLNYGTGFPAVHAHTPPPAPPLCLNPKSVDRSYYSSVKNLPKAPFTWSRAGLQSPSSLVSFQFLSPFIPF